METAIGNPFGDLNMQIEKGEMHNLLRQHADCSAGGTGIADLIKIEEVDSYEA